MNILVDDASLVQVSVASLQLFQPQQIPFCCPIKMMTLQKRIADDAKNF